MLARSPDFKSPLMFCLTISSG